MNNHQKNRFADQIIKSLYNTVNGKKIVFYGWAFKKDTNDSRESAAIYVADYLLNEEAEIIIYDPKVTEEQILGDLDGLNTRTSSENKRLIKVVKDPYEATINAHAVAVLTEWDVFNEFDWNLIYQNMLKPSFIFDGRNILNEAHLKTHGFIYRGIGK